METKNSGNSKNISVTLDKRISEIPTYGLFLIRGTSDYMEIQLANKTETDSEIKIHVENIFRIGKESIPQFARQFANFLQDVSKKQESAE